MINKQVIVGRLGQAPELRRTRNGNVLCNLRVATSEKEKKGDEWVDHTEWFNVLLFGKNAENAERYLQKGSLIYVEGTSRFRAYEDREGNQRYTREILVPPHGMRFLESGGRRNDGGGRRNGQQRQPPRDDGPRPAQQDQGFYDDDLPF